MAGGRTSADARSATGRTLDILGAFERGDGALTVKEIAAAAHLPVSTTYRVVKDLVAWGGLERLADGLYVPGERLRQITGAPSWHQGLRDACVPAVYRFVVDSGHAVALSLWNGDRLLCVETILGRHTTIELASPGDELPVLATSAGKLMIATAPSVVDPFANPLPPGTNAKTITRQVAFARTNGYCTAYGEAASGQASLSVPVAGLPNGYLALTVLTPVTDPALPRLVEPLRTAAATVRTALGTRVTQVG
ncbi:IclR family transcriptional regulator [Pseudonocardia eucalypti]|uniref:IclR family transcriptional regulator n=1 Tax=Pseudonocardia eucalypti TaxID=648755 RepID=A0ABP9QK28_9PSEU|nr:DNA-binding IclR family transcriptional regulator [Pseudonocardia eucalypti]